MILGNMLLVLTIDTLTFKSYNFMKKIVLEAMFFFIVASTISLTLINLHLQDRMFFFYQPEAVPLLVWC